MIFPAIDILRTELSINGINSDLANIGDLINSGVNNNADIIISLINVEENRMSRDPRNYIKSGDELVMKNPAIHLNLTLLFTAVRSESAYGPALQNLQNLIQFFQSKYVFDHINTPALDSRIEKLILEMVSINLEQLNHLWSILGGRYQPSVVYKMRMVTIDTITGTPGSLIQEIETKYFVK